MWGGSAQSRVSCERSWSSAPVAQLKTWTTEQAKARMEDTLLTNHEEHNEDWEQLRLAGVKLVDDEPLGGGEWDSDDSDSANELEEEEVIDMTDDITHLRKWDADNDRKRSAKEVAADDTETEDVRQQAREWMEANAKKARTGATRGTRHGQGTRARQGAKKQRATKPTRRGAVAARPWSIPAPAMGGGGGGGGGGP